MSERFDYSEVAPAGVEALGGPIGIMNGYNRMAIGFRSVPQALKSD